MERYPSRVGTYSTRTWRRSFFGLGGLGLGPVVGDGGDVTVGSGGTPIVTPSGGGSGSPVGGGTMHAIDYRLRYRYLPPDCKLGSITIPQSRIPLDSRADQFLTDADVQALFPYLTSSEQRRLVDARTAWKTQDPIKRDAPIVATYNRAPAGQLQETITIAVMRPAGYDPILYAKPVLQPGTPEGKIFSAAYGMFFPDKLTVETFPQLFSKTGSKAGSVLPAGPFPYWVKMITAAQVQAVAKYAATQPDAFGIGAKQGGGGGSILMDSLSRGLAAGASTGNPYVAAGAAVATAIWEGISSLFDSGPSEPGWFTNLKKTAVGRPGDYGAQLMNLSNVGGSITCQRAWIRAGGDFTIMEAFDAVVKLLGGTPGGGGKGWLWIVLGAAAASLVGT